MIFEYWESKDSLELTFTLQENVQTFLDCGGMGENPKKVWTVEASSWEEACIKYHEFKGWEPYITMGDK